jgi:hypothetical protein
MRDTERLKSTRDIEVGDRIDLPDRAVIVTDIQPGGIAVTWFDDKMQGPYYAVLPHGSLHRTRYIDERNNDQSWWEAHPDITGKYREF